MNSGSFQPVIPETITVHLGAPDAPAQNVTVPFPDYIKNVASSEIYPTWPENAIRANILAQISFALNRVYTEHYRSRGYSFDITNSTAYDQSFRYGRDIFGNISRITDEIFNTYIRREGKVEPLFAQYCDGIEIRCSGLSQWGSVTLAEQGYTPFEILRHYYGDSIELVRNAPVAGISESYPGAALRPGTSGNEVRRLQVRLNRIRRNYPSIPQIVNPDGIYDAETEAAVREFQNIFGLSPDGIIGRATWYMIQRIYNAVKRLSELSSEGIDPEEIRDIRASSLQEGDTGIEVRELQYLLAFVGNFLEAIPVIDVDGIFGSATRGAVEAFQRAYGLPETGIVEARTWNTLVRVFRTTFDSLPDSFFDGVTAPYPGTPLSVGARGSDVRRLQEYLNRISDSYSAIPKTVADGVYGAQTAAAVRAYQTIFNIPPSGVTALRTWDAIAETYRELIDASDGN